MQTNKLNQFVSLQQQPPPSQHPKFLILFYKCQLCEYSVKAGFHYVVSKDTEWKEHCHSSLYGKYLIVAKENTCYTAIYFESTYICEKEEELLRIATTKVYPHAGTRQKGKRFRPYNLICYRQIQSIPVRRL